MPQEPRDRCRERAKGERVAGRECRRVRAVFGSRVKVAGSEHDGGEVGDVSREGAPPCEADFNGLAASEMDAMQACRQCRGVVRHDEVAGSQDVDQLLARNVAQSVPSVDDEEPGPRHATAPVPSALRDGVQQFARGNLWTLQGRAIGVRHRERVQWRVHVARIDRQQPHALFGDLRVPDVREMPKRRLAGTVCAPRWIRIDGGVARYIQHDGSASFARRRCEGAEQRLREAERAQEICRERALEILTFGVAEQRQRSRPKVRRVVDQHVEASELAENLQGYRIDVVLRRDVSHDAVGARMSTSDLADRLGMAGDERDAGALFVQLMDESEPEARGAAGYRDTTIGEGMGGHL